MLSEALLQTLSKITGRPDAVGLHACECGHPEMRRLPDGVYRCPLAARRSSPPGVTTVNGKPRSHSKAYGYGWQDGRYGEPCCFTDNHRLASLTSLSDRLDYYRGHREGRETRLRDGHLLEAS
jgi:hypothetical protein